MDVFIILILEEVREICEMGVEIVVMDVIMRKRLYNEDFKDILNVIWKEFLNMFFMVDIGSIEDVYYVDFFGFDLIGMIFYGYIEEIVNKNISDDDFFYLKEVLKSMKCLVIVEGKIDLFSKVW